MIHPDVLKECILPINGNALTLYLLLEWLNSSENDYSLEIMTTTTLYQTYNTEFRWGDLNDVEQSNALYYLKELTSIRLEILSLEKGPRFTYLDIKDIKDIKVVTQRINNQTT